MASTYEREVHHSAVFRGALVDVHVYILHQDIVNNFNVFIPVSANSTVDTNINMCNDFPKSCSTHVYHACASMNK